MGAVMRIAEPTENLTQADLNTLQYARRGALNLLRFECNGDEVLAAELFRRMVADAFADQFAVDAAALAEMVNAKLERIGAEYRVIRITGGRDA